MPKQFDNFGEVNKVDREYEKRTYFARAFVALDRDWETLYNVQNR